MLSDEIDDAPPAVPLLDVRERERRHFRSPQPTSEKDRQDGPITQSADCGDVGRAQQRLRLPLRQPVTDADAGRFHALHPADALGQFRREQPVVRRLCCELTNR
jgi:hypothetical protein